MQQLISAIHWLALLGMVFYALWASLDIWRMAFWETTAVLDNETREHIWLYRDAHKLFPWRSLVYTVAFAIVFANTGSAP
jgi:hypothetical protein